MAAFRDEVYVHRTNLERFCNALLHGIDRSWTQVTVSARTRQRPGAIQRCEIEGGTVQCNYRPVFRDKMRVRALIKAWKRTLSDRYLDLQLAQRLQSRQFSDTQAVYDQLRQNASHGGCVKFIRNELTASRDPQFFGERMFANYSWNTYYTSLLHWDDRHCYGLLQDLERQTGVSAGAGGSQGSWFQACRDWIRNYMSHEQRAIYNQYNIQWV